MKREKKIPRHPPEPEGNFGEWFGRKWLFPVLICGAVCFRLRGTPAGAAVVCFGLNSLLTFCCYAVDKRAAEKGTRRIPEAALHAWEFFCGWPGAFAAQRLLHHKNRKISYQIVFFLLVFLQIALLFGVLSVIRPRG